MKFLKLFIISILILVFSGCLKDNDKNLLIDYQQGSGEESDLSDLSSSEGGD